MKDLFLTMLFFLLFNSLNAQVLDTDGPLLFRNLEENNNFSRFLVTDNDGNLSYRELLNLGNDDADWYEAGTTNAPTSIDDDIFRSGRVAIGASFTPTDPLSLGSTVGPNQLNFNPCDGAMEFENFGVGCPGTIKGTGTIIIDFDTNNNAPGTQHFIVTHDNGEELFRVDDNENVGINTNDPKSRLQVSNGDVFIEDMNAGVIMKSPDGDCWRVQVDNSGNLTTSEITCP